MSRLEKIARDERLRKRRFRKRMKRRSRRSCYRQNRLARGQKSRILEDLRKRYRGKDISQFRRSDNTWIVRIPPVFSFIENPDDASNVIYSLVAISSKNYGDTLLFDHSKCKSMDIAASAILDIVALEIRDEWRSTKKGYSLGGLYPVDENVRNVIQCMGITKHLKVQGEAPPEEVADNFVTFDLFKGQKATGLKMHHSDDQEIAATRLVRYFDQCLRRVTDFKLSIRGQRSILKWTGEIITNAEEHSGKAHWYAIGYMIPKTVDDEGLEQTIGECQLAIFNFGRPIAESLQKPHAPGETQRIIQKLSEKHIKRKLFSRTEKFSPDDLWTLYALQDGVSRFSAVAGDTDRGKGTVEMIEAFQVLGKTKSEGCEPSMSLVSGTTRILFDENYAMSERPVSGGNRMVIAFNEQNDLEEKPDPRNVHSLEGTFPGTILTFRFFLDKNYLEEIKNHV